MHACSSYISEWFGEKKEQYYRQIHVTCKWYHFSFQTKSTRQMALEIVLLTKNQIFKITEKEQTNYSCQKWDQKHFNDHKVKNELISADKQYWYVQGFQFFVILSIISDFQKEQNWKLEIFRYYFLKCLDAAARAVPLPSMAGYNNHCSL